MTEIISIILTFLTGLGILAKFWSNVNTVLKLVKEVLDVPTSAIKAIDMIEKADDDKQWTNEEVVAIKDSLIEVRKQFEEAKDAIDNLTFLKMKVLK